MSQMVLIILIALGAAGLAYVIVNLFFEKREEQRVGEVLGVSSKKSALSARALGAKKEERRRRIEENLREMQQQEKKKARVSLKERIRRAGLQMDQKQYMVIAALAGVATGFVTFIIGLMYFNARTAMLLAGGGIFVGAFGLPLWVLSFLAKKRQEKFLQLLPDAIDIMVRGLRAGLPVNDAIRTIAEELPDPVGPEFMKVVEGQKVGITIDQGLEQLYRRMPLPEVNFLSIVMSIQRETGGNLSEALANLSNVLRERKKIKQKIKAMSQEAKVSAAILAALPILLIGGIAFLNPSFLEPMWSTRIGNIMAVGSAVWMLIGMLVMRKIINFKI